MPGSPPGRLALTYSVIRDRGKTAVELHGQPTNLIGLSVMLVLASAFASLLLFAALQLTNGIVDVVIVGFAFGGLAAAAMVGAFAIPLMLGRFACHSMVLSPGHIQRSSTYWWIKRERDYSVAGVNGIFALESSIGMGWHVATGPPAEMMDPTVHDTLAPYAKFSHEEAQWLAAELMQLMSQGAAPAGELIAGATV